MSAKNAPKYDITLDGASCTLGFCHTIVKPLMLGV